MEQHKVVVGGNTIIYYRENREFSTPKKRIKFALILLGIILIGFWFSSEVTAYQAQLSVARQFQYLIYHK